MDNILEILQIVSGAGGAGYGMQWLIRYCYRIWRTNKAFKIVEKSPSGNKIKVVITTKAETIEIESSCHLPP